MHFKPSLGVNMKATLLAFGSHPKAENCFSEFLSRLMQWNLLHVKTVFWKHTTMNKLRNNVYEDYTYSQFRAAKKWMVLFYSLQTTTRQFGIIIIQIQLICSLAQTTRILFIVWQLSAITLDLVIWYWLSQLMFLLFILFWSCNGIRFLFKETS